MKNEERPAFRVEHNSEETHDGAYWTEWQIKDAQDQTVAVVPIPHASAKERDAVEALAKERAEKIAEMLCGGIGRIALRDEFKMPDKVDNRFVTFDDGGQAMILESGIYETESGFQDEADSPDPHMFIKLQSWQDGARKDDPTSHPTMRSLFGRRVRITVEAMD